MKKYLLSLFRSVQDNQDFNTIKILDYRYNLESNMRLILRFAFLFTILSTCSNFYMKFKFSLCATLSLAFIFLFIDIFLRKKHFKISRLIFTISIHVGVVFLNYFEGTSSGNYLNLFMFLIISTFLYDIQEKKELVFVFTLTVVSGIFIFTYIPIHSSIQLLTQEQEKFNFFTNIGSNVFLICILSFLLLRANNKNFKLLQNKQQLLNTIYNSSLDAVFIVNPKNHFIEDCNQYSIELFGLKERKLLLHLNISDFFGEFSSDFDLKDIFNNSDNKWQGEITCKKPISGTLFHGYMSIVSFNYNKQYYKKVSILDISSIKRTQLQLQYEKEKAEQATFAKSRFLSNMSHELRTPLNGIIGTANLLLLEGFNKEYKNHFDLLKYSSEHMLGLVNSVLDYSKIEAGKIVLTNESFNLSTLLNNLQNLFANEASAKQIAFNLQIDDRLNKLFWADSIRIGEVISNLISNALKFTKNNGTVALQAYISNNSSKEAIVVFKISDTGIGIPKEKRELVFENFTQADIGTTRKFGGTGLGLSISKKIVELYKGTIVITDNENNIGCCFLVTLKIPFDTTNINYIAPDTPQKFTSLKNLSVLIAEDNPINMKIAKSFLNKWDITVTEAENGLIALDLYKENDYDVLLIDLDMPVMDGYELISNIRKTNINIPAIAFTAAVYDDMISDLKKNGFTDYLQKPFRPMDLHKKLNRCLVPTNLL